MRFLAALLSATMVAVSGFGGNTVGHDGYGAGLSSFTEPSTIVAGKRQKIDVQVRDPNNPILEVTDGFVSRNFLLYVPTPRATAPTKLILNFHGNPSTAETHADYTAMDDHAETHNYLVAYPEGVLEAFNAGGCCADAQSDDEAFALSIVEYVKDYTGTPIQAFSTGWSNGGYMSWYLGCKHPEVFSAIASVGGLSGVDPYDPTVCVTPGPRVLSMHETGDDEVPYADTAKFGDFSTAPELVQEFAFKQQCTASTSVVYTKGEVECIAHDCPAGREAVLCTITGGAHTWPGSKVDGCPSCEGTPNLSATDQIWKFFNYKFNTDPHSDDDDGSDGSDGSDGYSGSGEDDYY